MDGYLTDNEYTNLPFGGYIHAKVVQSDSVDPVSFSSDSWETINFAILSGNTSKYNVGDTKEIDMGSLGTHTLRIANKSTPAECSQSGFSQTACGFVLEFADIITKRVMNSSSTNVGGWPETSMRTYVNNDIYNALPSDLKDIIIDTTVVSGHGSTSGESNFTSIDKLYLLSAHEVWSDGTSNQVSSYDTAYNNTRQLDYYSNLGVTTNKYSGAIKKNNGSGANWWLRTKHNYNNVYFQVDTGGDWSNPYTSSSYGVSPAFRIG